MRPKIQVEDHATVSGFIAVLEHIFAKGHDLVEIWKNDKRISLVMSPKAMERGIQNEFVKMLGEE